MVVFSKQITLLRTHGPEHSIFVTDTFILIPYALTWDSMMYTL